MPSNLPPLPFSTGPQNLPPLGASPARVGRVQGSRAERAAGPASGPAGLGFNDQLRRSSSRQAERAAIPAEPRVERPSRAARAERPERSDRADRGPSNAPRDPVRADRFRRADDRDPARETPERLDARAFDAEARSESTGESQRDPTADGTELAPVEVEDGSADAAQGANPETDETSEETELAAGDDSTAVALAGQVPLGVAPAAPEATDPLESSDSLDLDAATPSGTPTARAGAPADAPGAIPESKAVGPTVTRGNGQQGETAGDGAFSQGNGLPVAVEASEGEGEAAAPQAAATGPAAAGKGGTDPEGAPLPPAPAAGTAAAPTASATPTSITPDAASAPNPAAALTAPGTTPAPPASSTNAPVAAPAVAPEARFAEANHPSIVAGVRGQLLPNGGSMQIRLDPPELGALFVQVSVRGGVMEASFQTSNAEAAQLLSHSLAQLKHALENHGVTVDRLQVAQAPARAERPESPQDRNNPSQQNPNGQSAGGFDWQRQSEQQRREMIRRMWARLGVGDPLDLVA